MIVRNTLMCAGMVRKGAPGAVLAVLLLAGCSSGHVGEDWQCPLAAGGSCASVAAADPAVPKADAARTMTGGQPVRLLPRDVETKRADVSAARGPGQAAPESRSCKAECGFDPFAWLARLFGTETEDGGERPITPKPATLPAEAIEGEPNPTATDASATPKSRSADPADDLRTGEAVARIWIAPFVDAGGIYREASHVRVVLEPAGWRLPR